MYKFLGFLNIATGFFAIFHSLYKLLFPDRFYALALEYEVAAVESAASDLKFFLVLILGLAAIFLGYKTVEFKPVGEIPYVIHWYFMTSSLALDALVVVGVVTGV